MKNNFLLYTLLLLSMPAALSAETYYIDSSTGSDNNSGTFPTGAWKTLTKVNLYLFNPGDTILFKSGEEWSGILHLKSSGSECKPIIIDKYGGIKLPVSWEMERSIPMLYFLIMFSMLKCPILK